MKTYILLLRGINVGGHNLIPMKALTALLTGLGFKNVKTYIQSGNVVLQSDVALDQGLAGAIEAEFGFKPDIMVLEHSVFKAAAAQNPYAAGEGKAVHLYFSNHTLNPDTDKLNKLAVNGEAFTFSDKVFYLHAPNGIGRSKLAARLDQCLGVPVTGRNLNTVNKLLELSNLDTPE